MNKEVGRGPSLFVLLALTHNLVVRKTAILYWTHCSLQIPRCKMWKQKYLAESNSRQLVLSIYYQSFRKIYQICAKDTKIGRIPKVDHSFSHQKQKS